MFQFNSPLPSSAVLSSERSERVLKKLELIMPCLYINTQGLHHAILTKLALGAAANRR